MNSYNENKDNVIQLRAEFKHLRSVVSCIFQLPRHIVLLSPQISIETNFVSIRTPESIFIFHLPHLTLKPQTCHGLRWSGQNQLYLALQATLSTTEGGSNDGSKKLEVDRTQDSRVSEIKACQSCCSCLACGAQVLRSDCNFQRVLPLPSDSWSDYADMWFCHNHQTDSKASACSHGGSPEESTLPDHLKRVRHSGLHPRPEDCLVGCLYMLVGARQLDSSSVLCSAGQVVCRRCTQFLGLVEPADQVGKNSSLDSSHQMVSDGICKLFFHCLKFGERPMTGSPRGGEEMPKTGSPPGGGEMPKTGSPLGGVAPQESKKEDVEIFLSNYLKSQSQSYTSYRFIIDSLVQKESENNMVILVWLLDQDLVVFSSCVSAAAQEGRLLHPASHSPVNASSAVSQEAAMLQQSSVTFNTVNSSAATAPQETFMREPALSSRALHTLEPQESPMHQESSVTSCTVTPRTYMKVLYQVVFMPFNQPQSQPAASTFSSWKKDSTVDSISMPRSLSQTLAQLLISSTRLLPAGHRTLNGFYVGYLKSG